MIGIALVALLAISGSVRSAQVDAQVPVSASVITMNICGKDIDLGVLPKVVFDKFEGTECVFYKTDQPNFFAIARGKSRIGTVKFTNGVLTEITREWAVDISSPEELARAVVDSLQEVEAHGTSQCILHKTDQANPSFEARSSVLKCGMRTLLFSIITESGQSKFQIEEILSK